MTIPIQPIQIAPTQVVKQPNILEQGASLLEAITQQAVARAQMEQYRSLTEERRAKAAERAQALKDEAEAANAFYQHLSGAATRLKPSAPNKVGAETGAPPFHLGVDEASGFLLPLPQFEKGLSPRAHTIYGRMLAEHNAAIKESLAGAETQARANLLETQNTIAQTDFDEDRRISAKLNEFAGRAWNRKTIGEAVGAVTAINPQKAQKVAAALSVLMPQVQPHINPDGTISYVPQQPGPVEGAPVQPQRPSDEQNKLATYGVRVLEAHAGMTRLEQNTPGIGQGVDQKLAAVRSIEQIPGIGRAAATQALRVAVRSMTPTERQYFGYRTDMGNALLRRASGAQINMEELDRETVSYVPIAGEDEQVVATKQGRRLQQGLLFSQQAGSAFDANSLSPAARRYILRSIAPHPGYSSDNPFANQPGTSLVPQP